MSIIDPKYRGKYTAESADWLSKILRDHAYDEKTKTVKTKVEGEDDKVEQVPSGKASVNLEKLFDLAEANGIKARELYGAQVERPNAAGRLRMTIGNSLRAAAKRRHGLNVNGEFVEADAAFIGDSAKTENADGTKIPKAPKADAAPETAETENVEG